MNTQSTFQKVFKFILAALMLSGLSIHAVPVQTAQADGSSLFNSPVYYPVGSFPSGIALGDLNGDGRLDIATANSRGNSVSVLVNIGSGAFASPVLYEVGAGPISIAVFDLNGDGKPDIATADANNDTLSILINTGNGTFSIPEAPLVVGDAPYAVTVGDFNKDGKPDLAAANGASSSVSVLLNAGGGTFLPHTEYPTDLNPVSLAIDDFNRDGKLDLVTTNVGSATVNVLLGKGDGTFQAKTNYGVGSSPSIAIAEDFNNDGLVDLAVANSQSDTLSLLLGNGNGTFQSKVDFPVGDQPYGMTEDDFNLDGRTDLVTANFYSGDLTLILNQGSGVFAPPISYPIGQWQSSVRSGDLDQDGKFDLVTYNDDGTIAVLINAGPDSLVRYVTPTGTGNCSSWTNACGLQTALTQAQPGSEIWVAAGTYTPTNGTDRTATFTLKDGVAIYGGFAGTETQRLQRDWKANVSILSGEIGVLNNPTDNSLHLLKGSGLTATTVLDGFTITGGNANINYTDHQGGGLYLTGSSPTLANLTFTRNQALAQGGAVFISNGALTFTNCAFIENTSGTNGLAVYMNNTTASFIGGEARGNTGEGSGTFYIDNSFYGVSVSNFTFTQNSGYQGAAVSIATSNVTLTDVAFLGNHSTSEGGAVRISGMYTTNIKDAVFHQNSAGGRGGAVFDASHDGAQITQSVFTMNETPAWGGGVHSYQAPTRIINSTFFKNKAGVRGGAISSIGDCAPIRNSIVWGNTAPTGPQVSGYSCEPDIASSLVEGAQIVARDPSFVSTLEGSLDLRLKKFSPAINVGSANYLPANTLVDLDGNPRIIGSAVDLGAYEQQNPNHQPVMVDTLLKIPQLSEDPTVNEGILVRDLIKGAGTDADGDDLGIVALWAMADDHYGFWEYFWIGQWWPVHTNTSSGRYLTPDTRIRFHPVENWNGTHVNSLSISLWDGTDGGATGDVINARYANGDALPFSDNNEVVSVTVRPVNDAPVLCAPVALSGAPMPGGTLSANPGGWCDVDSPNSQFTFAYQWRISDAPGGPWQNIPGAQGSSYVILPGHVGKFISFVVTATDNGVGEPPTMSASAVSEAVEVLPLPDLIAEGETVEITMDEDGSPEPFSLTLHGISTTQPVWSIINPPARGSASVASDGTVSYAPVPDDHGTVAFTVQAQSGDLLDTIIVRVTIRPRNDAPAYTIAPSLPSKAIYNYPLTANPGVWNDNRDLHPGSLSYAYQWQLGLKAGGPWSDIIGATGLTYTPVASDVYHYLRFVVRVTDDGEGMPATMTTEAISPVVEVINTKPVILEGDVLDVTASPVQLHATDADNHSLSWRIHIPPSHGSASVSATGLVTYTLYSNCTGMDDFTVRVSDGETFDSIVIRPPAGTCRFYVDDTAAGANNGSSWANAFTSLQKALTESATGDKIWVAEGTYLPTTGTDRTVSFALKEGVELYGGFRGNETSPSQRDWKAFPSKLSGNIGSPTINTDNSYHVVTGSNLTTNTVLDGFMIMDGNAFGWGNEVNLEGGGMMNYPNSSPTLRNLLFWNNEAVRGGGLINSENSSPVISNVEFFRNHGYTGGGMTNEGQSNPILTDVLFEMNTALSRGGGMANDSHSNPFLRRVRFIENAASIEAQGEGGGLYSFASSPTLIDVYFLGNSAYLGGAINGDTSAAVVVNAQFLGNSASTDGGALFHDFRSTPTVTNAVFYGNSSQNRGGAIFSQSGQTTVVNASFYLNQSKTGGAIYSDYSNMMVRNSILWGDVADANPEANVAQFENCIVQGIANNSEKGVWGDASHNPRYASPDYGDFQLLSGSPAINAGLNTWLPADTFDLDKDGNDLEPLPVDIDGANRLRGTAVDLGAYEFEAPVTPMAVDDTISAFDEDTTQTLDVLANDSDPNGGSLTITAVTQGSKGSVSIQGGKVRYEPNKDVNGTDSFTYTVSNTTGLTDTAAVYLTILPVNDAPTLSDFADVQIVEGETFTIDFTVDDAETAPNLLTILISAPPNPLLPPGSIAVTGTDRERIMRITPVSHKAGVVTVTVIVVDKDHGITEKQFVVTVIRKELDQRFYLPVVTR